MGEGVGPRMIDREGEEDCVKGRDRSEWASNRASEWMS